MITPWIVIAVVLFVIHLIPEFVDFNKNGGYGSRYSFNEIWYHDNEAIKDGEWYRLISAGFVHGDWMHLILNLYGLYLFGANSLFDSGPIFFVIVYFGGLIAGSLASFLNPVPNLGASGAIFSLIGCVLVLSGFQPNLLIYILISYAAAFSPNSRINIYSHTGGLVFGILITLLLFSGVL